MPNLRVQLTCFNRNCGKSFSVDEVLYECPTCGALLETENDFSDIDAAELVRCWQQRRLSRDPLDVSGVWRYREILPFADDLRHVVTLQEGNTLLLDAPRAARYGGLSQIQFKHQGYNPTASFKDNGMTAGVTQAVKLGMNRVACVSTGNTSASMAAYAAAAGMRAIIFIPHGNIAYGKLAQALEYGALTLQVEANFDQILALVRELTQQLGIYLLNSINPFPTCSTRSIHSESKARKRLLWKCSISAAGKSPTGSSCRAETSGMCRRWERGYVNSSRSV